MLCQCGNAVHICMSLSNGFIGECLGYFRCLCEVCGCINASLAGRLYAQKAKNRHGFILQLFNHQITVAM